MRRHADQPCQFHTGGYHLIPKPKRVFLYKDLALLGVEVDLVVELCFQLGYAHGRGIINALHYFDVSHAKYDLQEISMTSRYALSIFHLLFSSNYLGQY